MSWRRGDGYDLVFNRDELDTRAPETAPAVGDADGVKFLAPRDGAHGGTWLMANEHGLTVCLLNDYACLWRPVAPAHSRGHLVLSCADAADTADVPALIQRQPLERTPAFHLLALGPGGAALVLHWDGAHLTRAADPSVPLLSSSSYATHEVIAGRRATYAAMVRSPERPSLDELMAFQRQHDSARGAQSVLMRRPDARTRSITHVVVREDAVTLEYQPVDVSGVDPLPAAIMVTSLPRRRARTFHPGTPAGNRSRAAASQV